MDALITLAADRRAARRHFVDKKATLILPESGARFRVSIRNMSTSGAGFRFEPRGGPTSLARLPATFDLLINDEGLVFRMRLCWHKGEWAGGAFEGEPYYMEPG
jgi:hypothetical protein